MDQQNALLFGQQRANFCLLLVHLVSFLSIGFFPSANTGEIQPALGDGEWWM